MLGDDEVGGFGGKGIGEEVRERDIAFRIDVAKRAAMVKTGHQTQSSLTRGRRRGARSNFAGK
jgi:hypothetical protein